MSVKEINRALAKRRLWNDLPWEQNWPKQHSEHPEHEGTALTTEVRLWHLCVYSLHLSQEQTTPESMSQQWWHEFFAMFVSQESVVTFCLGEKRGLSWKSSVKEMLSWKTQCHMPIPKSAVLACCPVSSLVSLKLFPFVDVQWTLHFSAFFHYGESGNSIQVKAGLQLCQKCQSSSGCCCCCSPSAVLCHKQIVQLPWGMEQMAASAPLSWAQDQFPSNCTAVHTQFSSSDWKWNLSSVCV